MYPRNSMLADEVIAGLLELEDLRIGRHPHRSTDLTEEQDFWVQSIWRAQVLPAFDAAVVQWRKAVLSLQGEPTVVALAWIAHGRVVVAEFARIPF
jgi:hypothetical protein